MHSTLLVGGFSKGSLHSPIPFLEGNFTRREVRSVQWAVVISCGFRHTGLD
jgi:hypothetical protein